MDRDEHYVNILRGFLDIQGIIQIFNRDGLSCSSQLIFPRRHQGRNPHNGSRWIIFRSLWDTSKQNKNKNSTTTTTTTHKSKTIEQIIWGSLCKLPSSWPAWGTQGLFCTACCVSGRSGRSARSGRSGRSGAEFLKPKKLVQYNDLGTLGRKMGTHFKVNLWKT